jgi:predicted ATPase
MVTSRGRLNLHGERVIEVDGLEVPPAAAAGAIAGYSATQLFLTSARATMAEFTLDATNELAVARICRLVSGLPLAIELAASWARHLSCEEIAAEIGRNLGFLATTHKNVPARHRSLEAAFDHSWALLGDGARATLARMAVFRGGCDRPAASAVAGAELAGLAALADRSLLRRSSDGRYTVHELLRQYGETKLRLQPHLLAETQANHCRYYVGFLAAREDALTDARQSEARREIAVEIDNIRAAWEWAVAQLQPGLLEPALESMRVFLEINGWYAEGVRLFADAANAERAAAGDGTLLGAKLLARQAWCYHRLDRFEPARELIRASLAVLANAQPSLPAEEAHCLACLGNMAREVGDFSQSIADYEQSLARHRVAGNPRHIAYSLNGLAVAHAERGDFDLAQRFHEEGLALRRELGDIRGVATALVNLGFIALGQGRYRAVKPLEQEALAIFRQIGYPLGAAVALNNWGVACSNLEEYVEARPLLEECLAICRELGHRHTAAHTLGTLGGVAGALGDHNAAWQYAREGLQMAQEIASQSAMLYGLYGAAALLARQDEPERAVEVAALVYHHPATNRETKDRAGRLLAQLERSLPPPLLAAVQERGRSGRLEEAVAATLRR